MSTFEDRFPLDDWTAGLDSAPDTFASRYGAAPLDAFQAAAARTRAPFNRQSQTQDIGQTGLGRAAQAAGGLAEHFLQIPDRLLQASQFTGMPPPMSTPEDYSTYEAGRASVGPTVARDFVQNAVLPAMPWQRFTRPQLWGSEVLSSAGGSKGGKLGAMFEAPTEARLWKPQIVLPTQKELFDYSRIGEIPNVPQFDLARYDPKYGMSDRVADLIKNKRVERKMLELLEAGKSIGPGAEKFYGTEPLRDAFIAELGQQQGPPAFARYMDYASATSPRSKVRENVRNATYYYVLDRQGKPMPEIGDKNPAPYGHMAQRLHQQGAQDVASGGWDVIKNPKPPSYSQNLQGNLEPVTVDAHAYKLPAMLSRDPRFLIGSYKPEKGAPTIHPRAMYESGDLTMKQALKEPTYWVAAPNDNEYAALEQYYKRLAKEVGLAPGQGQGSGWAAGGPITGLGSVAGEPFLRSVEQRAVHTAKQRGITPAEALSQFMRGYRPLLAAPPAAAIGSTFTNDADASNFY